MQVKVAELRTLTDELLSHLEETGHGTIDVDVDYYWNIPTAARYNPYQEPQKADLGQLTDDWSELQKILVGKKPPLNCALVWLAAILQRIGEAAGEIPAQGGNRNDP